MSDQGTIGLHIMRVVAIVRNVALKRALHTVPPQSLSFWRLVSGNALDMAVLEWCKVFGTDAEPSHWKAVVGDHGSFRTGLLSSLNVSEEQWNSFWKSVRDYRNELLAHHSFNPTATHYPKLDLILESSIFYYQHLIGVVRATGDMRLPDDLRTYYSQFLDQATTIAKTATASTSSMSEMVDDPRIS